MNIISQKGYPILEFWRMSNNIDSTMHYVNDAKSVTAYSHYLIMKAQATGNFMFDGQHVTEEEMDLTEQCRTLCDKIVKMLPTCMICDIPELLECYDIMCRIGYNRIPDKDFIDRNRRRMFNAWEAGDKSIQESSVFGITVSDMSYHPKDADRGYVKAYLSIKRKWVDTLVKHSYFPDVTAYENYQRLALIMRENLDKYIEVNSADIKLRWYEHNRVGDLSTLGSQILRSYRRFVGSLFPAVIDFDTKMDIDNRILSELATRTDLDPYDRKAFRIALEFNNALSDD